jgi:hypothetical protein
MSKTKINYWVDLVIALAFVFSAVSGIIFLFPISGSTVLGISYNIWDQIHTWGSLLMIVGVLAHLVLHWKWIVAMTKKTFFAPTRPVRPATTTANGVLVSRRQFLRAAGLGAVALGTAAVGYKSLFGSETAAENEALMDDSVVEPVATSIPLTVLPTQNTSTQSAQTTSVACPKGLTYDPYPGKCHHYIDTDGDGYCDYSIPSTT